ncbi:MAG: hypothetical protein F4X76_03210 [Chloroflexi bacterium]|nr:hypothetical protein [Chloroflexota bacterium]
MPRHGTANARAELAVDLYGDLLDEHGWELDEAWLAIAMLLVTCEIWRDREWRAFYDAPVLQESNNYGLTKSGKPNAALSEAMLVKEWIAAGLNADPDGLCSELGRFFRHPDIVHLQPNNPRGHAFRSLVAETLARFGDQQLEVHEEVSPRGLFPGFDFGNRSQAARIDIVVQRGQRVVALITTRWTYRHDRVDIIDEALTYVPSARRQNNECRFFRDYPVDAR